MRYFLTGLFFIGVIISKAQFQFAPKDDSWKAIYRASDTRINDLVHTKLDAHFDYAKSYLYGKVWITLKPHFYATDSLRLDAKGMSINKVAIIRNGKMIDLDYVYDSLNLNIKLDRTINRNENYTVYIDYTSKPDEFGAKGSAAITDAKGLYFINPLGKEKDKPTQIWTQGETEGTSVWVPTIDRPNQKTTNEFWMTVPAKYVTLSNGKLVIQKKNADGTRTDVWKMDQPHAPYLFFMGIGDFAIVKDSYKGKEVSYYVDKPYEKVARRIFGNTPEMIKFYSSILGVEYPWVKYAQMVGQDYVSGAMENTTATLHQESAQQNARQLTDGNSWESTIAHELFHQWFGDLVTSESWSNITLNESFANYSEVLWEEYKNGKDAAADQNYSDMLQYFSSGSQGKDLVRYIYRDKEDLFDRVSYNKGGRILHMLRNYVGDSAFFKSLNLYLTTNKFKSAEAANLRLAFEEVTGKDLMWFWNQWYYGSGHPKLEINYGYDAPTQMASVFIKQTQTGDKIFKLPFAIDVYHGLNKVRHEVWMDNKEDTFSFKVSSKPDFINVDGDKILLAEKKDDKTTAEFAMQYKVAKTFVDRREALDYAIKHVDEEAAKALLLQGLDDPYFKLRERTLRNLKAAELPEASINKIENIAKNDPHRTTRAEAINTLADLNSDNFKALYISSVMDSSYTVAGAALEALVAIDEVKALSLLPTLKKDAKGKLKGAVEMVDVLQKGDADFMQMTNDFDSLSLFEKFSNYKNYIAFLGNVQNTANFKKGVDKVVEFRNVISGFSPQIKASMNELLQGMKARKIAKKSTDAAAIDEQAAYIDKVTK